MRIALQCNMCQVENGTANPVSYVSDWLEDSTALIECQNGHTVQNIILAEKYELLAENAVSAIHDGYYREAISAFSSSLERFYEFYLEILSHSKDQKSIHDRAWKEIKNQSERQLGDYIYAYLNEEGEMPVLLKSNHVELRNKVIHKGRIPTLEEVIKFGESIIKAVRSGSSKLEKTKLEVLNKRKIKNQLRAKELSSELHSFATYSASPVYSQKRLCDKENKLIYQSLKEWIEVSKAARNSYLTVAPVFEVGND